MNLPNSIRLAVTEPYVHTRTYARMHTHVKYTRTPWHVNIAVRERAFALSNAKRGSVYIDIRIDNSSRI